MAPKREEEPKKEQVISTAMSANLPPKEEDVDGVKMITSTTIHIQFVGPKSKVRSLMNRRTAELT